MAEAAIGVPTKGVIQISFIVEDLRKAMTQFTERLNAGPWFMRERSSFAKQTYRGQPTSLEVSLAMAYAGGTLVELIQQHNDVPSVYREVAERRGYGFHHWGVASDRFDETVAGYLAQGYEVGFEAEPVPGVHVAYIDTTAHLPGMIEVIEMTPQVEAMFASYYQASLGWDGSNPVRVRAIPRPAR